LVWVSSSQKDLEEFPDPVKETMLFALDLAKVGAKHGKAKPFKGFSGSSVLEIVQRGLLQFLLNLFKLDYILSI
jgi:phage-related protein